MLVAASDSEESSHDVSIAVWARSTSKEIRLSASNWILTCFKRSEVIAKMNVAVSWRDALRQVSEPPAAPSKLYNRTAASHASSCSCQTQREGTISICKRLSSQRPKASDSRTSSGTNLRSCAASFLRAPDSPQLWSQTCNRSSSKLKAPADCAAVAQKSCTRQDDSYVVRKTVSPFVTRR